MGLSVVLGNFDKLDLHRPSHLIGLGSAAAATWLFSVYTFHKITAISERRRLRRLTKRKQAERQKAFADLKQIYRLTPEGQAILNTPTDALIDKLQAREVTAKAVLEAFIAKSLEVNDLLNCITEYIPQALEWAEKLDSLPVIKGPLHGIPFCVKDDTDVKGMDSTLGYAKFLYDPATESAAIVKVLRDLGAVPFCKTNVPMSVLTFGSHNPVFGTTLNAHFPERRLAPGGSSSGTGALVAGGGAIFGTGSDIGGSLRLPAHCNGISTLRPTFGRLTGLGVGTRFLPGIVGLLSVAGVMAPAPNYLTLIFKSMVEGDLQRKYDGKVVPLRWNAKMFNSQHSLRIGYYTSLPEFPALGSTEKTIIRAKEALENKGHILVPFDLPTEAEMGWNKLFGDFCLADLAQNLRRLHFGEERSPAMRHLWMIHMPPWAQRLGAFVLKWIPGCHGAAAEWNMGLDCDTSAKLWKGMTKRAELIEHVLSSMDKLQLDLIICPVFPSAALGVEHNHQPELFLAGGYTWFWNLVDMPAGVVRFGTETGTDDSRSPADGGSPGWRIAKQALPQSVGMPIGVQVVGKKFEEEMILRLMNELDDIYQMQAIS